MNGILFVLVLILAIAVGTFIDGIGEDSVGGSIGGFFISILSLILIGVLIFKPLC